MTEARVESGSELILIVQGCGESENSHALQRSQGQRNKLFTESDLMGISSWNSRSTGHVTERWNAAYVYLGKIPKYV